MTQGLRVESVSKRYGPVTVLDDISFRIDEPEVFAITGENGAGKSTLLKIMAGLIHADAGTVQLPDHPESDNKTVVSVVHQHLSLAPLMTIAENCSLNRMPTRHGFVDRAALKTSAVEAMALVGLDLDPGRLVAGLSFAERQLLEIGRALAQRPQLLLLDEPTASLTPAEVDRLFSLVRQKVKEGVFVGYVSHRMPEIFALCDSAVVLRDGRLTAHSRIAQSTPHELVAAMVGRETDLTHRRPARTRGPASTPTLTVSGLTDGSGHGVSFTVDSGEIVGLGGLVGAGRTELLRMIFGLDKPRDGSVAVDGRPLKRASPMHAVRAGMAFVQEDRHSDGLALELTSAENLSMPMARQTLVGPLLDLRRIRTEVRSRMAEYDVRPRDARMKAINLSGGNQQKLVLGRWAGQGVRVLLLDEPTLGVDVHAKAQIHERIRAAAESGAAVVLATSDLQELLTLSDRVLVMRDHGVVAEIDADGLSEETVVSIAAGGVNA